MSIEEYMLMYNAPNGEEGCFFLHACTQQILGPWLNACLTVENGIR